jgi:acyl-CoA thioester hydrolase
MPSIELKRRVRWADSDPAGRINFPRFFDYMEDGEAELMRSCGLSYRAMPAGYSVPRVHTECTFKKILDYDVPFTMRVTVGKLGTTSIRYDYQFFREGDPPELAAEGSMTVVVIKDGRPIEIPSQWRTALSEDRPFTADTL